MEECLMATVINTQRGAFVPTTNIWDVTEIYSVNVNSDEFKELLVRLYQKLYKMSILFNLKDTGYYPTQEFVNSQLFFPNPSLNSSTMATSVYRQVFRMTINFGPLPDTG